MTAHKWNHYVKIVIKEEDELRKVDYIIDMVMDNFTINTAESSDLHSETVMEACSLQLCFSGVCLHL